MGKNVNDSANDDGPCRGLVQQKILVERDNIVKWRAAKEGDEVAADGQKNEDDVDVKDERSSTGDS